MNDKPRGGKFEFDNLEGRSKEEVGDLTGESRPGGERPVSGKKFSFQGGHREGRYNKKIGVSCSSATREAMHGDFDWARLTTSKKRTALGDGGAD